MSLYIRKLIAQGENQQLDFKFEISDAKKIARTFSAFANTDGGILLIGVKDNGVITGVRTEEEVYMAEAAADIFCKPKVEYGIKNWNIDGKWVLEITIPKSMNAPHKAPWKDDKYLTFVRVNDKNHVANRVVFNALVKINRRNSGTLVKYKEEEKVLLQYLNLHSHITVSLFKKLARISFYKAEKVLANLIAVGVIKFEYAENGFRYVLNDIETI